MLLDLSVDPYQEVATNAQPIVDYITALLLESPFKHLDSASLTPAVPLSRRGSSQLGCPPPHPFSENELERSPNRSDTMTNSLLIDVAMKCTAFLPASEDGHHSPTFHSAQFKSERQGISDLSRPPSSPNMNIAQYASPYARPQSGAISAEVTNTSFTSSLSGKFVK